jgi:hypothetical protein
MEAPRCLATGTSFRFLRLFLSADRILSYSTMSVNVVV